MKAGVFRVSPSLRLLPVVRSLVAACLAAGLAAVALRPTGAGADTFNVTGSWYWANQPQPAPPPVGQPLGNVQPPDVPSSDFAVSAQGGSSEKETYLHIGTSAIPPGSTVSNFVLTLNEDATAPGDGLAAQAAVKAYPATSFFADGVSARPYGERPPYDAKGTSVAGKRVAAAGGGGQPAGAAWTFDLTDIVNSWLSGSAQNNGIALVPDTSQSQNFEVVWAGPTTNPSVAGPPKAEGTVSSGSTTAAPPVPVGNAASGPATPSSGAGASPSVTVPVSSSGPGVPSIDQPLAPPANPTAAAAPSPAPAQALRRAASHRAPPAGFWVGGLAVILLGLASMTVLGPGGDPGERRRGSVLRALERRAAQGAAAPTMTDAVPGGAAP